MKTDSAQKLLHFLQLAPTAEEKLIQDSLLIELDKHHTRFQQSYQQWMETDPARWQQQLQTLQVARTLLSNSLLTSSAKRMLWDQAQIFIHEWVQHRPALSLEFLVAINRLITSDGHASHNHNDHIDALTGLRKIPIFTTCHEHALATELPWLMDAVFEEAKSREEDPCIHPLQLAAFIRQSIISIHPFLDANGRSSQLFVDAYLISKGYLPQSFTKKMDGLIVGLPEGKSYMTPHLAFQRVIHSVMNSYQIFLDLSSVN